KRNCTGAGTFCPRPRHPAYWTLIIILTTPARPCDREAGWQNRATTGGNMPIVVKPIERITAKYIQRAGSAGADYKAGVMQPRRDYVQATVAAANTWKTAVTQAAGDDRFARGV